jgi:aromatic ring-cleaving dioxygenase
LRFKLAVKLSRTERMSRFLLLALLATLASAHMHHESETPHGPEGMPLYQQYLNSKSHQMHTREVYAVEELNVPEGFLADLFFPPLPGQSPIDFHPQLKKVPGPRDPLIYYSWHIHSYFFGGGENPNSTARAMKFRTSFMTAFNVSLCPESCFMGGIFDKCDGMCVWDPVMGVDGPHVVPQWGVFLPNELLAQTLSWMSANHGEFSILFHPNTGEMIGDHDPMQRAMWISDRYPLDLEFLRWLQCRWFHDECPTPNPPKH